MVAAWSVDRLGRSLTDLLGVLQELHAKGVDLYLHQQGLDTSTPSGRAMYQMLGVFAEFERAIIRERVMAGLARAKAEGTRLGRPATSRMTQPRSERSAPPAPQARASAPLRASTAWVSGRSRASPHKSGRSPRQKAMRPPPPARRPLASPDPGNRNGRNPSRPIFRSAEIVICPAIL